jgi:hypothetical protein
MGIVISIVCGLAIAGIIMMIWKGTLKSVRHERTASNYVRSGSFKLINQNDVFLYDNVTKRPRAQPQPRPAPQGTQGRSGGTSSSAQSRSKGAPGRGSGR